MVFCLCSCVIITLTFSKGFFNPKTILLIIFLLLFSLMVPGTSIILCYTYNLTKLILIVSSDVELNPGPGQPPKHGLEILYSNIRSLGADFMSRFGELELRVKNKHFDVIALSEVGDISSKLDKFELEEYSTEFYSPNNRGIIVYVHSSIYCKKRADLLDGTNSYVWFDIKNNHSVLTFGAYYRSPSQLPDERRTFFNEFKDTVSKAKQSVDSSLLVVGDFNSKHSYWCPSDTTSTPGRELKSILDDIYLEQVLKEPTRYVETTSSCIDIAITDSPGLVSNYDILPPIGGSDHCAIHLSLDIATHHDITSPKGVWKYDKCNLANLKRDIESTEWNDLLLTQNVDSLVSEITDKIFEIMQRNIPRKMWSPKPSDKPWMNGHIKAALNKRNSLYRKFKTTKLVYFYDSYKDEVARVNELIKNAKLNFNDKSINDVENLPSTGKQYWKLIKRLLGNKFSSDVPVLIDSDGNTLCNTSLEKSNLFLKIFSNKYHLNNPVNILPNFRNRCNQNVVLRHTSVEEIKNLIAKLEVEKANGPDGITNKMLKLIGPEISHILSPMFNRIIDSGHFPSIWKHGIISVVHKKDKKSDPNNYRPITLLSVISKLFERLIYNSIYNHLKTHELIYKKQSGFLPGHSTTDQLLTITSSIFDNFEKGYNVRAIFLDITAAFDSVPHNLLLHKIKSYGLRGNVHKLVESYLSKRRIKVKVNNTLSKESNENFINSGVPQGSILGPLLFLLYINDLPENLVCDTYLYADDASIFAPIDPDNPQDGNSILKNDLDTLSDWADTWGLAFKPSKCRDLIFAKRGYPTYRNMTFANFEIPRVNCHKHLGFYLDSNLNFNEHVINLIENINKKLNPLRALSYNMKSCHLNRIYTHFIKPHYDYCDIIYHCAQRSSLTKLEQTQYKAALLVSGCIHGSSKDKVFSILNWKPIIDRRIERQKIFMFKVENKQKPCYVLSIFNSFRTDQIRLNRNTLPYSIEAHTSTKIRNSPTYSLISTWNDLNYNMRSINSLSRFKSKICKNSKFIQTSTSRLKNLNRKEEIYLNRLRVDFLLNSHLYSHNFTGVLSPNCTSCGSINSTIHFLYRCQNPAHRPHINALLTALQHLGVLNTFNLLRQFEKTTFLLFGSDNLNSEINAEIVKLTAKFSLSYHRLN